MSTWVIIKGPDGNKRLVKPGEPYTLAHGELIAGIERVPEERKDDAVDKLARHFGMNVADFVELAARALGIPPCPACQIRKMVLYRVDEIGWRRSLILLWRTFRGKMPTEREISEVGDGE